MEEASEGGVGVWGCLPSALVFLLQPDGPDALSHDAYLSRVEGLALIAGFADNLDGPVPFTGRPVNNST